MKKKISLFLIFLICVSFIFAAGKTVYVTEKGKKYHKQGCQTLKKSSDLTPLTVEEAENMGYKACKVCGG